MLMNMPKKLFPAAKIQILPLELIPISCIVSLKFASTLEFDLVSHIFQR